MSSRPAPPLTTDSPDELAVHVSQNASEWLLYLRNINIHVTSLEEEASSLRAEATEKEGCLRERDAVINYQEKTIQAAQQKNVQLELDKARLLNEATPAVQTPLSHPTHVEPLVDLSVDPTPRATLPTPVASSGSAHLSEKLPDPKEFDGTRSDLRRFTQQVYAKMTANADRFPAATARLTYVAGRLTGKAYELILPKTQYGIPQFIDYPALLEYLEAAFGDPDRVQNAQNKLYQLKQKNLDFSIYLSEFQRLALEGEMPEDALTPLLFQGISRELQDMLLHNPSPTREFRKFALHLQGLDNRYRQHQQQVSRTRNAAPTSSLSPKPTLGQPRTHATTAAQPPTRSGAPVGEPMDLSSQRRGSRRDRHECFRCGSTDHFVANCPHPDTRPASPRFQNTKPIRAASPRDSSPLPSQFFQESSRSPERRRASSPAQSSVNGASLH